MPANPNRRRDLHNHLVRSSRQHPDAAYLHRLNPDWPICTCGWPVDPAAGPGPNHPNCQETT